VTDDEGELLVDGEETMEGSRNQEDNRVGGIARTERGEGEKY
jgi:hypothetical protein